MHILTEYLEKGSISISPVRGGDGCMLSINYVTKEGFSIFCTSDCGFNTLIQKLINRIRDIEDKSIPIPRSVLSEQSDFERLLSRHYTVFDIESNTNAIRIEAYTHQAPDLKSVPGIYRKIGIGKTLEEAMQRIVTQKYTAVLFLETTGQ